MSLLVWDVILAPLYLLGAYLAAVLIREIIALLNMQFYRRQGISCKYIPWLGINYVVGKGKGSSDENQFWWRFMEE